jgi:hypothetical protein
MPLHNTGEAEARLAGERPLLSEQDIEELLPWMRMLGTASVQRLQAEITYASVKAIRKFDRTSSRVARLMIGLIIAQILMAAAQVALAMRK